jgi:hypothetical protein
MTRCSVLEPHQNDAAPVTTLATGMQNYVDPAPFHWLIKCKIQKFLHFGAAPVLVRVMMWLLADPAPAQQYWCGARIVNYIKQITT